MATHKKSKQSTTSTTTTSKKSRTAPAGATATDLEEKADVLFQKIYDKWYAFSVVEDDCLVSEVPQSEVDKRLRKVRAA